MAPAFMRYSGGGRMVPVPKSNQDGSPPDVGRDGLEDQGYEHPNYDRGVQKPRPLDRDEIKSVVSHEIQDSLGHLGSEIAEDRRKSLSFYYGRPFGNEQEGRSSVVLTDVLDTVEWILPTLVRMFLGGDKVVRYVPKSEGDIEAAAQATEYINHVFLNEMDGFSLTHNWFKDALIEKNGIVKSYYEERREPKVDTYRGLNEEELMLLLEEEELEPIAFREYEEKAGKDPQTGEPVEEKRYDITVRVWRVERRIKVDGVPPEEFLIARRAIELDDYTEFTAHRKKLTVSDLIAMGFPEDQVLNLPSDDTPEFSTERTERLSEDETYPITTAERADPASRDIWTTECFIRIDEDGDGYAELRKIWAVGENTIHILEDEEVNRHGFASLCPVPMPHKFFGLSIADLVMDLQLIRSTLLRQMLDNIYLQNNQRMAVVEGAVEIDDLLTSRPGGVVRQDAPGMIEPLVTPPLPAGAWQMLEYLESVRENRTGITRYNQGMDASSLNQTATGINAIMGAAQARVELIARIFSSTGMKRLFRNLLRLMVESPLKERVVRLRGKWVTVDPSTWNADMDVEIEVGLGVGQAAERIQHLDRVLGYQEKLANAGLTGYMVKPENIYAALSRLTEAMGFNIPELFFTNPEGQEPPKPEPSDDQIKTEMEAKKAEATAQLKAAELEVQRTRDQQLADFRLENLEATMVLEREKIAADLAIARMQADEAEARSRASKANGASAPGGAA